MTKQIVFRNNVSRPLTWAELDGNIDRLLYASGTWAAGTYTNNELVWNAGGLWYCLAATTTDEPSEVSADWSLLIPAGGFGTMGIGDIPPPPIAGPDLGAGWVTLNQLNSFPTNSYGVQLNTTTGEFIFDWAGTWTFNTSLAFSHDELNAGRQTNVRFFNVTTGLPGKSVPLFIARNQPGTNFSAGVLVTVAAVDVGRSWRLEMGGGDAVATMGWVSQELQMTQLTPRV